MTRNKKLVKMMALAVAASTVATSVPAYAAFDATYYAQQNPDVVAAIGTKPADLEMHYNVFGKKEGRAGSADEIGSSALRQLFDAEYYAKLNPDVVAVYGNDANALFSHFLQFGIKEGRKINPYFDVNAYKKAYPDLVAAFGDDIAAYYNHFATNGIKEHRTLGGFPAEKIVPGGVAVASSGGSSSSSSGGGGGSSKPAPKPADVTPTPDPTPAPQPEPEPEPEPAPVDVDTATKAVVTANAKLANELDKYIDAETENQKAKITKAQQNALVTTALANLNDAKALVDQTAGDLKTAEAEKKAADKALTAAENAVTKSENAEVSRFADTNREVAAVARALGSVTYDADTNKFISTSGYYGALVELADAKEKAALAATAVEIAQKNLADAKAAHVDATANAKATLMAVTDKSKAYVEGKDDADLVEELNSFAGDTLDNTAGAVNAKSTVDDPESDGNLDIISDGVINEQYYQTTLKDKIKLAKATVLDQYRIKWLKDILTAEDSGYISEGGKINDAGADFLATYGVVAEAGATAPDAIEVPTDEAKLAKFAEITKTKINRANTVIVEDTKEITLDAAEKNAEDTETQNLETLLNKFKAAKSADDLTNAIQREQQMDEALNDETTGALQLKEEADDAVAEKEEALADAKVEVEDAITERDAAYSEAGVAGNSELAARDAAQADALKEAYEQELAEKAADAAADAADVAKDNYDAATKLDTEWTNH